MINNVVLVGRPTGDIELRTIGSGQKVANFTLAVDKGLSKAKKQEFESAGKPTANFIRIVAWGKTAEFAAQYVGKGKITAVTGNIETGSYQDDMGNTVYTTEVNTFNIQPIEWKDSGGNVGNSKAQTTDDMFKEMTQTSEADIPF